MTLLQNGYSHDGDEITLDPATCGMAKQIHDRYLAGEAVKDIVSWLNDHGVTGRNGQPVGYTFVTGILKNWCYAGVYTWGKKKDESGKVGLITSQGDTAPKQKRTDDEAHFV